MGEPLIYIDPQKARDLDRNLTLQKYKEKHISSLEERLVESEEQVKKLRCRIKTISSRKNSPVRGNSPDLYKSITDLEMATITELSNAIDGYLDAGTVSRTILIDQIKRATRQLRRKDNNLQQDLVREQRRRYDAEAERDVCTRERDDIIGERDLAILAYNNERKDLIAECFHIGIKIGVSKDYCEKNLLNSYCISEILTVFSKIPDGCRLMPKTR